MNEVKLDQILTEDEHHTGVDKSAERWRSEYETQLGEKSAIYNRSGIKVEPLYTPSSGMDTAYLKKLGFPGQEPMTRGIYPTMHRGRTWSQRQLT